MSPIMPLRYELKMIIVDYFSLNQQLFLKGGIKVNRLRIKANRSAVLGIWEEDTLRRGQAPVP